MRHKDGTLKLKFGFKLNEVARLQLNGTVAPPGSALYMTRRATGSDLGKLYRALYAPT